MKNAKTTGRVFLRIEGKFVWIITRAVTAKMKQTEVIIFIEPHCGNILLKKVMLNIHPLRLRKLTNDTIKTDIHTVALNESGTRNEYQCDFGVWSEKLPDITTCL